MGPFMASWEVRATRNKNASYLLLSLPSWPPVPIVFRSAYLNPVPI